ncbi:MAG: HAD family hydrolase [Phycisphaerales bacterium]
MLILFDIDGTLIRTHGAGMRALEDAGREVVGPSFSADGIDFAGSLDPVIIARMLERAGHEVTPTRLADVRARYPAHLRRHLARRPIDARGAFGESASGPLPGVVVLLDHLTRQRPAITLGLLTGNFEEGARLKLEHCGLDHDAFTIRVYGDDSPHTPPLRDHLPPVATERFTRHAGRPVPAEHVLIIGDTAHDVACARAHGHRSLAVATGGSRRDRLEAAGADLVVDTLEDLAGLVKWIDAGFEQGAPARVPL